MNAYAFTPKDMQIAVITRGHYQTVNEASCIGNHDMNSLRDNPK